METEHHKNTLQQAVGKLASYEPDDAVWRGVEAGLKELPLQNAIKKLSDYEPNDATWNEIEMQLSPKKSTGRVWWFAAAASLILGAFGLWMARSVESEQISYSQETVDSRLSVGDEHNIDSQYERLKIYCEEESLVCRSQHFKRLKQEYEILSKATNQLKQAMGQYNAEPELIRQFTVLEQEKADVLNEMAKMI